MTLPALALCLVLAAPSAPLQQGQPAPFAGVLSDVETVQAIARRVHAAEAERDALRATLAERAPDYSAPLLVGALGLALGFAAGWVMARR